MFDVGLATLLGMPCRRWRALHRKIKGEGARGGGGCDGRTSVRGKLDFWVGHPRILHLPNETLGTNKLEGEGRRMLWTGRSGKEGVRVEKDVGGGTHGGREYILTGFFDFPFSFTSVSASSSNISRPCSR